MNELRNDLTKFLSDEGWRCNYIEKDKRIVFDIHCRGELDLLHYNIVMDNTHFIVNVSPAIEAVNYAENLISEIGDFLVKAMQESLRPDIWYIGEDGIINYQIKVRYNKSPISIDTLRKSIYVPVIMYERYGGGIKSIIVERINSETAFDYSHNLNKTIIHFNSREIGSDIKLFNYIIRSLEEVKELEHFGTDAFDDK